MLRCMRCMREFDEVYDTCPHCGAKNKKPFYKRWWFILLVIIAVIGVIGVVVSLLIQPWTSQWMDVVSIYICPLGAMLAGIMFFWVYKKEKALDAVNHGAKKPIGNWFYPLGKYVYCVLALVALVLGAIYGGIG